MRIVTVETTDHSYQGRLIEETPTQVQVRYRDENREIVTAWYNKDICEIECGAPRSRGDDSLKSQRAFYQELMDDGYVLVDYKLNLDPGKHWEDENGNVADYLCQFEKDGVKFYLPNNEDWFDVIAVDHKHKLALNTGFCEYDDIKADHGEYRWVYDGTKLVMGASNLKPAIMPWHGYGDGALRSSQVSWKKRRPNGNLLVCDLQGNVYDVHPKVVSCGWGDDEIKCAEGAYPIRWKLSESQIAEIEQDI